MNNDLIELVRFQYIWQAQILSAILEESMVDCYVTELNALETATGFVIYVNELNSEKAKQLLYDYDHAEIELTEELE